jgi:hypothetical protein
MASNGLGITESLVHAPVSNQGAYAYRSKMGMVPSAEWDVFFDDFHTFVVATAITNGPVANTPWGWQGAVIDSGATAAVTTTAALGATGVLTLSDATASEGVAFYGTKSVQLTARKRFFMEARVRTDDVSDNAIQFGLSALTATTNPEDLWTTTAADLVSVGILDGSAYLTMLADKSNSGSTAETSTTRAMVADTWHTIAFSYDGGSALKVYLDGLPALTWSQASTTIPTGVALAPFIGVLNGNGAGGATNYVDYIRYVIER